MQRDSSESTYAFRLRILKVDFDTSDESRHLGDFNHITFVVNGSSFNHLWLFKCLASLVLICLFRVEVCASLLLAFAHREAELAIRSDLSQFNVDKVIKLKASILCLLKPLPATSDLAYMNKALFSLPGLGILNLDKKAEIKNLDEFSSVDLTQLKLRGRMAVTTVSSAAAVMVISV